MVMVIDCVETIKCIVELLFHAEPHSSGVFSQIVWRNPNDVTLIGCIKQRFN